MKNLNETKKNSLCKLRRALINLSFVLPFFSMAQVIPSTVLNGTWQGILKQVDNKFTDNYAYWVSFTSVKGDSVFGVVRTEDAKTPYYAIISIRGKITNNHITFIQDKILKENPRPAAYWCLIKGELTFDETDNSLSGSWDSDMAKCKPGSMLIYKTPKQINWGPTVITFYSTFPDIENKIKKKVKVSGYKVILSEIHFVTNSHKIEGNSATNEINKIYDLLNKNEVLRVHIQGHTDNVGEDDFNMKLSYLRAKEIYNLLIEKGVKESRITYEGYGKSRPIATNETEKGRLENRRVEIEIEVMTDEKVIGKD